MKLSEKELCAFRVSRYLAGLMVTEEITSFEEDLAISQDLRDELKLQCLISEDHPQPKTSKPKGSLDGNNNVLGLIIFAIILAATFTYMIPSRSKKISSNTEQTSKELLQELTRNIEERNKRMQTVKDPTVKDPTVKDQTTKEINKIKQKTKKYQNRDINIVPVFVPDKLKEMKKKAYEKLPYVLKRALRDNIYINHELLDRIKNNISSNKDIEIKIKTDLLETIEQIRVNNTPKTNEVYANTEGKTDSTTIAEIERLSSILMALVE